MVGRVGNITLRYLKGVLTRGTHTSRPNQENEILARIESSWLGRKHRKNSEKGGEGLLQLEKKGFGAVTGGRGAKGLGPVC